MVGCYNPIYLRLRCCGGTPLFQVFWKFLWKNRQCLCSRSLHAKGFKRLQDPHLWSNLQDFSSSTAGQHTKNNKMEDGTGKRNHELSKLEKKHFSSMAYMFFRVSFSCWVQSGQPVRNKTKLAIWLCRSNHVVAIVLLEAHNETWQHGWQNHKAFIMLFCSKRILEKHIEKHRTKTSSDFTLLKHY